jgi:TPR repeat protein
MGYLDTLVYDQGKGALALRGEALAEKLAGVRDAEFYYPALNSGALDALIEKAPEPPTGEELASAAEKIFLETHLTNDESFFTAVGVLSSLGASASQEAMIPFDKNRAVALLKEGIEKGSSFCKIKLLYLSNLWSDKPLIEESKGFIDEFQEVSEELTGPENYMLGMCIGSIQDDDARALKFFEKASEQGIIQADYTLGLLYTRSITVPANKDEAVKRFRAAASKGLVASQMNLGTLYSMSKEYIKALSWLEKAAAQGNAQAMFMIATLYLQKNVPDTSGRLGVEWLQKSADSNWLPAITSLGYSYFTSKDPAVQSKALHYFAKGASMGDGENEYLVYVYHSSKLPGSQGTKAANQWLQKSIEHGYVPALKLYANALERAGHMNEAYSFHVEALRRGDQESLIPVVRYTAYGAKDVKAAKDLIAQAESAGIKLEKLDELKKALEELPETPEAEALPEATAEPEAIE